jgi:hypothetical protein
VARHRKSIPKKVAVEAPVVVPVTAAAEATVAPVEAKPVRPARGCVRCGVTGDGLLCRRCGVVLHGRPGEGLMYTTPVSSKIGY